MPLLVVAAVTGADLLLLVVRRWWSGQTGLLNLAWNLFLAWLPLVFALLARSAGGSRGWRWVWAAAWLFFLPNAPYLFTDLVHLAPTSGRLFWVDLMMVLPAAVTGLVLGFLAVWIMQGWVEHHHGARWAWTAAVASLLLAGYGVYLGRFHRLNSWDVLMQPSTVVRHLLDWLQEASLRTSAWLIPLLFGVVLILVHFLFWSLTRLAPRRDDPRYV